MDTQYPFVTNDYGVPVSETGGINFDVDYSNTSGQNVYPENYYDYSQINSQYVTYDGGNTSNVNDFSATDYQHVQFTADNNNDVQGDIKMENYEQIGTAANPAIPYGQHDVYGQSEPQVDLTCANINSLHIDTETAKCSSTPRSKQTPAVPKTSHRVPRDKVERSRPPTKRPQQRKPQASAGVLNGASENVKTHNDQFTQWYQMMSQYYNQFYSGYQGSQTPRSIKPAPTGPVEVKRSPGHQSMNKVQSARADYQHQAPAHMTAYLPPPVPQQVPPAAGASQFDYANYYYQYYYGAAAAAAAAQMWPGGFPFPGIMNTGRQTPRLYHTPHIRAWLSNPGFLLQILPNRPLDGELARIELLDISQIANDAVAEATKQTTENDMKSRDFTRFLDTQRDREVDYNRDGCSSNVSGVESPGGLSSLQCPTGDESVEDAGARMCAIIAVTWDRTDHVFFPGPLNRCGTLKADVLAFLRDKLAEIQDRMPIDWESAGLLISYLELLVKSNGVIQPSDLVNLLLQGHEPQTYQFNTKSTVAATSQPSVGTLPYPSTLAQQSGSYLTDSLSSLHSNQLPSGQQSPQLPYGIGGMMAPGGFDIGRAPHLRAASETGGYGSSQAILRRAAAAVVAPQTSHAAGTEDRHLDRFRELLMHGLSMKALEHACRCQLWGHAFTLAHRIGQPIFEKVMDWFVTRAVAPNDPILTLYQLTAGEMPQIVTDAAYGKGSDNGDWRPHLAMILSGESSQPELSMSSLQRLGDSLMSRRLVYAAHLCYLLMGPQYEQIDGERGHLAYNLPEKVWLLGMAPPLPQQKQQPETSDSHVLQKPQTVLTAPTEAIQLTEIYEYAMQLTNRNYRLCQLLPFRLVYATRLIDAGLLDKAYRYLAAIGDVILAECASSTDVSPFMYSLMSNCLRLTEPLLNHPDLGGFEMNVSSVSHFQLDRRTSASSSRRSAGFLSSGNENWIAKLRELHDQAYKKFHCRPNQTLATVPATRKSSDAPTSVPEPTNRYDTHAHQRPVQQQQHQPQGHGFQQQPQDQQHQMHNRTPQHSGPQVGARDDRILPAGQPGFAHPHESATPIQPSSPIRSQHSGHSHPQPIKLEEGDRAWQPREPATIQHTQLHASQLSPANYPQDRLEDCPTTPVNIKPSDSPLSAGPDFSRRPVTQHTHSEFRQFSPMPAKHQMVSNRPSATPHSPTAASSSSTSIPTERPPESPYNDQMNTMTNSPRPHTSSDSFFTPMSVSQPYEQGPPVFDYFAGLQQQMGPRSRNASTSSQSGTVIQAPDGESRSRSNSGTSQSRRPSANYERPTFSSIQRQNTPQQPQAGRQSNQHSIGHYPQPIQEAREEFNPSVKPDEQTTADKGNQDQSKEGWLSGIFGRWKGNGSKNVHLPDDSKPSIVWDDERKRWIDVANPDASDPSPPPPPTNVPGLFRSSTGPQTTGDMGSLRGSARSRYVNVLGNSTSGPAVSKMDSMLPPPLPPTALTANGRSENHVRGGQY